jgi:hypothetical protein
MRAFSGLQRVLIVGYDHALVGRQGLFARGSRLMSCSSGALSEKFVDFFDGFGFGHFAVPKKSLTGAVVLQTFERSFCAAIFGVHRRRDRTADKQYHWIAGLKLRSTSAGIRGSARWRLGQTRTKTRRVRAQRTLLFFPQA